MASNYAPEDVEEGEFESETDAGDVTNTPPAPPLSGKNGKTKPHKRKRRSRYDDLNSRFTAM